MDEELKEKLNSWFDRPRWISKNCEATRLFTFLAKEGYVVVKKNRNKADEYKCSKCCLKFIVEKSFLSNGHKWCPYCGEKQEEERDETET